ncbi:hypothetical protein [Nocardia blacklockiae]|uniref:hypothetical protein n=1 Tax=Nocardia blacklockiae TaxID=480036 RepID=UPI001894B2E9|nr:hypothetical protein [Nocardia blacklockiae]MBF6174435.1 hypothetical protein [Nocardia blacklockiae]
MSTSIDGYEVARHFGSRGQAQRELQLWKTRKGREYIAERVLAHVSTTVHDLRPHEIRTLQSSHPLGNLHPPEGYKVKAIKNWHPGFAFAHLFHFCLEDHGTIYSFDQFFEWAQLDEHSPWLWTPMRKIIDTRRTDQQRADADASLRWRIGLAYYGFIREIYTVACLRDRGLPMLSHPLADALFRADTWCLNVVVEIFVRNSQFKSGTEGRKHPAEYYLADQPQFRFERLEMEHGHEFGRVHLPTDAEVDACADRIRRLIQLQHTKA